MTQYKIDKGIPPPIHSWQDLVVQMDIGDSVFVKNCEADSLEKAIKAAGFNTARRGEDCGWRVWKLKK